MKFNYIKNCFISKLKPSDVLDILECRVNNENVFKNGISTYKLKVAPDKKGNLVFWLVPNLTRRIFVRGTIKKKNKGSHITLSYFPAMWFQVPVAAFFIIFVLLGDISLWFKIACALLCVYFTIDGLLFTNKDINILLEMAKAKPEEVEQH